MTVPNLKTIKPVGVEIFYSQPEISTSWWCCRNRRRFIKETMKERVVKIFQSKSKQWTDRPCHPYSCIASMTHKPNITAVMSIIKYGSVPEELKRKGVLLELIQEKIDR